MAVSSNNGGLGLLAGDLVVTALCWTIGIAVAENSSGGSWGDGGEGESEIVVSGASSLVAPTFGVVCGGTAVSGFEPPGIGSGKHSRFDFSQRGQTQFLDLESERGRVLGNHSEVDYGTYREARRFRSDMGESIPPTPSAAFPRRGKKPCRPRIAVTWVAVESCVTDGR